MLQWALMEEVQSYLQQNGEIDSFDFISSSTCSITEAALYYGQLQEAPMFQTLNITTFIRQ